MWGSTVISLLCSIAKSVSWFRPKRIVTHACQWGNYLNKLEKLMLWSLISLNLQCYNHSLLSYNHRQVIRSLLWEANSGVTFFGQSFSLYLRGLQNVVLLYLSVFYILLQNHNFVRITYVGRLLSSEWQYSHANESNSATAMDDVKQKFTCCGIIWILIS